MLKFLRAQATWSGEHRGAGCGDVMVQPMLRCCPTLVFELRTEIVTETVNHVLGRCAVDMGRVDRLLDRVALELDSHDCFWIDEATVSEVDHQAMMSEEISTEQRYTGLSHRKFPFVRAPIQLDCPRGGAVRRDGCSIGRRQGQRGIEIRELLLCTGSWNDGYTSSSVNEVLYGRLLISSMLTSVWSDCGRYGKALRPHV